MIIPGVPENESQRLKSLYFIDLIGKNGSSRFDRLTRLARQAFDVPFAVVSLLDKDRQWLLSASGTDLEETPRAVSFCAHAILEQGVFVVRDTLKDPRFCDNPFVKNEPHIRFYAGCPVRLPDGMIAGIICIADNSPRFFSTDEANALLDLASIVEDEFERISLIMTDETTGLLNRRGFLKRGEEQLIGFAKKDASFMVMTFHLLNLASIDDLFGANESEKAIRQFSTLLSLVSQNKCLSAHVGNGRFILLLTRENNFDSDRLLFDLQTKIDMHNQDTDKAYKMNFSYGMVESEGKSVTSLWELIERSDKVNYSEIVRSHS